jgi:hypothetical protein
MSKSSNSHQVGGSHYRTPIQHWDYVWANNLDYFQGQIIKYVTRWSKKNGVEDLKKAQHFLEKYIELVQPPEVRTIAVEALLARSYPFWEKQGSIGTSGDRGLYRCLRCGFKITANGFEEANAIHGKCPNSNDLPQPNSHEEPKEA